MLNYDLSDKRPAGNTGRCWR